MKKQIPYTLFLLLYNCLAFLAAGPCLLFSALPLPGGKTQRLRHRLGQDLTGPGDRQVIWIHALSVGEVTSALPLVNGLRRAYPEARLVVSVTTTSGMQTARRLVQSHADLIIFSPLDFLFTIRKFLRRLRPSLFILVETDFWPNWLEQLQRQQIPSILVNGRISERSRSRYHRFRFFFRPMFENFTLLAMQTARDRSVLEALGVSTARLHTLGNLKYDQHLTRSRVSIGRSELGIETEKRIWVCGSTHPGEEEIIFQVFARIADVLPDLALILAPRNIGRGREITRIADQWALPVRLRSLGHGPEEARIIILDTIGELAGCYRLAELAFVGGSLIPEGGHNPLEPAGCGIPVLFGPHMEDFPEIAAQLCSAGGARTVDKDTLEHVVRDILEDASLRRRMGAAAISVVREHDDVIDNHLQFIATVLDQP